MFQKIINRPTKTPHAIRDGRYVVIDWNESAITACEIAVRHGDATLARSFFDHWPADTSGQNFAELKGAWLRQHLQQHGIAAANAIVSVPRRRVSLRLLEFPAVGDDELASLVELQVESQLDAGAPELPFDYLPQPTDDDAPHRFVLLATIAAKTLADIHEVATAAGLTLQATCVGELALDALTAPKQERDLTLSVLTNHAKAELVFSFSGVPIASHSVRMPKDEVDDLAKMIPGIISRTVAALPERFHDVRLAGIELLGPYANQLREVTARLVDCTVVAVTVQDNNAVRPLAVINALRATNRTIDFLTPRRPADAAKARRIQWIRHGVSAAVLVGLMTLWQHMEKRTLQEQLRTLTVAGRNLTELNDRGTATLREWEFVNEWQSSAVNWSDEVKKFTKHLPAGGKLYLTRLQVDQPSGSGTPVIRADGIAKDADVAMSLNRSLMTANKKYEVRPHGIEPALRDADFQSSFRIEATIRTPSPTSNN